jgi:putative DNA primase/helicase
MISLDLDRIPPELKTLPQWVCFRHDKVPMNPKTGNNAKADDPDTWGEFEQAVRHWEAHRGIGIAGVGFEFSLGDPYTGVDLDKCRDLETGMIEPWAQEIVDRLQSYTEFSPSGGGLHILVRGKLPPGGNRKGKIEMYDSARYFTMTGQHLEGTPSSIEPRQAELDALHVEIFGKTSGETTKRESGQSTKSLKGGECALPDDKLVEKICSSKIANKFRDLYHLGIEWLDYLKQRYGYPSQSEADLALASILAFWTGKNPAQMDSIFRSSKLMRDKWDEFRGDRTYGEITIAEAIASTAETWKGAKRTRNRKTTKAKSSDKVIPSAITGGLSLSDLGNARRLVAQHGPDLHYCYISKKWYVWNGRFWAIDNTGEVIRRAKQTVGTIYAEAAAVMNEGEREKIASFALKSEGDQRIKGMIRLAESEPGIPIIPGMMDANSWLLNCENGTVDLTTGTLRGHDRADLITRLAPVEFNAGATCKIWDEFLSRIMDRNYEIISFIQRSLGYSLTGSCQEQCFFILWGGGSNGKSTLLNTVSAILGSYSMQTPTETLLSKKQQAAIPNDIARLDGPRFVTALEVDQNRRLSESLVKQLTGQDTISARYLFGEFFDFVPQFKLFLSTNHKPVIKDTSYAIWRRIRLIPFNVEIPEPEQDKELSVKLKAEWPGILAWIVRGCLSWRHGGLGVPEEVTAATGNYRAEMDALSDFFTECCMLAPQVSASAKELYQAYCAHAEKAGEKRFLTQRDFGLRLGERGLEPGRGTAGKHIWRGIGLIDSDPCPGH